MKININIYYLFIGLFLSYIYYDQLFLPLLSTEIPLNSINFVNENNITIDEIIIYPDTAYLLVDKNNVSNILNIKYNNYNELITNIKNSTSQLDYYIPIFMRNYSSISIWTLITIYLIYHLTMISMSSGLSFIDKKDKDDEFKKYDKKLEDIAGFTEIKNEAMDFIDLIKNYNSYKEIGTRIPRGAIFIGPPGTGKTLLAKAIAGECGLPFYSVSGSEFNEVFVGLGSARVKSLFEKAKKNSPCIIFIDEIDALAQKRSNSKFGRDDRDNTLNALLVEMDGFNENDGIIVLAATNRVDVLDPAILRPGRFDRKIHFSIPDRNNRKEIFNYYLNKIKLDPDENRDNIMNEFLSMSFGFSGADISNLCNEACIMAGKNKEKMITHKYIRDAFDYVTIGSEKKNYYLTDIEKKTIAFHEVGHAFLAYSLKNASDPIKISMIPRGQGALGYTLQENPEKKLNTRVELFSRIGVMCGGRIAEEVFLHDISTGASDDFKKATELAKSIYSTYSMMDDTNKLFLNENYNGEISDRNRYEIEKISNNIILDIYKHCKNIIVHNKDIIKDITKNLRVNEYLNNDEIFKIFPESVHNMYDLKYFENNENKIKLIF